MEWKPYNRTAAVQYAHRWAYQRNPEFFNYDEIGGDCTNFASQCLYAGGAVMNRTPDFGWYYENAGDRAPAWTGVPYLFHFLTRTAPSKGPVGELSTLRDLVPGDLIQLRFGAGDYGHTLIVVEKGPIMEQTLVAAHSMDADYRPLSSYRFRDIRFVRITGIRV